MRLKYSMINGLVALSTQVLMIILNFISRSLFISILGIEYLGINGLFSNILTFLSLSELGIGTAITFSLYKAVSDKNQYNINALITLYSRVYACIAIVVFVLGIILSIFLEYLIIDNPFDIDYLRIAFLLFVLNSAVSYLWSYRSCIVFVNQKDYILKLISFTSNITCIIIQIILLKITQNYIVFLIIQLLFTIINNFIQSIISKKMYPNVVCNKKYKLCKNDLNDIIKRIKSLFIHSISSTITFGTDNIIISKFIAIKYVGLYSNYQMIINAVNNIVVQFFNGITASMGNLISSESTEEVYRVYKKLNFICFWIYSFLFTILCTIINTFILLWIGDNALLEYSTVIVLLINFYIMGLRQPIFMVRNCAGLYTKDKIAAILKPMINLSSSIILANKIGLIGVFIGTLVSSIVSDVLISPYYLNKYFFENKYNIYLVNYLKQIFITLFSTIVTIIICDFLVDSNNNYIVFVNRTIISCIVPNIIIYILYRNTEEYNYFKKIVHKLINKKLMIVN